jgi:hypothetical protein
MPNRLILASLLAFFAIVSGLALQSCTEPQDASLKNTRSATETPAFLRTRWTLGQITETNLESIVQRIARENTITINASHFSHYETKQLSGMTFHMFTQLHPTENIPVAGASIRIWLDELGQALQIEADVLDENILMMQTEQVGSINPRALEFAALNLVALEQEDNTLVHDVDAAIDVRKNQILTRVRVRASKGWHSYWFAGNSYTPVEHTYRTFTRNFSFGEPDTQEEFSLDALTYPVADAGNTRDYKDNGVRGELVRTVLKHIKKRIPERNPVRYFPLESRTFSSERLVSSVQQLTDPDIAAGFWSYGSIMSRLKNLAATDYQITNEIGYGNPVRLVGRYASVYWHPDAARTFGEDPSKVRLAPEHTTREGTRGIWFTPFHYGIPFLTANDGLKRAHFVVQVEDKSPRELMEQGFDEIQTYHMVTTFFEVMQSMGLTDPEISTKPVNVVLYNPTVNDNAYATLEGEINFGIYSSGTPSMARNNTTGWHELSHELIGRISHPELGGPASWGMHEGVSDFLANAIARSINDPVMKPHLADPRPYNSTLFHMNNEVHDAGEAFGGALLELTELAEARFGKPEGTKRVVDLVLQTLRLIRGNPFLTEESWYQHILFADSLSRKKSPTERRVGELTDLVNSVFGKRNMRIQEHDKLVRFDFSYQKENDEPHTVTSEDDFFNIELATSGEQHQTLNLKIDIENGSRAKLNFPLTVWVFIRNPKAEGVPIGPEKEQQFTLSSIIYKEQETLAIPIQVAAACPQDLPPTFSNGKKVKICQSRLRVVLTEKTENKERPANHQKRGMLSLIQTM